MAIAFGAASSATGGSSVTSMTWSHTISGTQRILVAGVYTPGTQCTGMTYNGVAMTDGGETGTASGNIRIFYLFTPDTGAHNIVATFNGPNTSAKGVAASYTGVTGPSLDATSSNGGTGTSLTVNITTSTNNDWIVGLGFAESDTPGAGAGTTSRVAISQLGMFDSNAPISPAGSTSLVVTAGSSMGLRMRLLAVKPATSGPTTTTSSSTTSTSTSTSSTTSSSSTSTSSTTTATPPPDMDVPGIPTVYVRN